MGVVQASKGKRRGGGRSKGNRASITPSPMCQGDRQPEQALPFRSPRAAARAHDHEVQAEIHRSLSVRSS